MFEFIISFLSPKWKIHCEALPTEGADVISEYTRIQVDEYTWESVNIDKLASEHPWYQGDADVTSGLYVLETRQLRKRRSLYEHHADVLNDDTFVYKSEYLAAKAFYADMKKRHASDNKHLTRQLIEAISIPD